MIQKSPYGAIYVKLNYMEWMKQGSDILRHVMDSITRKLSLEKHDSIQLIVNFLDEFRLAEIQGQS
jgi:hypothetical protein